MPKNGLLGLDAHLDFYHPDDRRTVRERIANAAAGRGTPEYQNRGRMVRPDGDVREMVAQGFVERDEQGRVVSLHGILIDMTETLRAERRAMESGALLRATLESVNQGILMVGPDRRVRVHNRRVCEMLGVPERLLRAGTPFEHLLSYQDSEGEFEALTEDDRHKLAITSSGFYERRRSNGTVIEVRTQSLVDGGFVRTFDDVTERHGRQAALEESERRYRLLAENTSDVIIWCDLDATRRYVSPAAEALFGFAPGEMVGTKSTSFVHPDEAAPFAAVLDDLRHARVERARTRQRYRHKNGSYVWCEVSFDLVRDPDTHAATGWVAALRDISARKVAEDALRISEERLALALENGSDGFWDCDLNSGAIHFSGRWSALLGFDEGEMASTVEAWCASIHPEDCERTLATFVDHLKGRTSGFESEYRLKSKSGAWVWAHGRGKVVARNEQGRATRAVGTHSDITKRKEAEGLVAHMALHDALTGLPNRVLFKDRLQQAKSAALLDGRPFAVLACDLDRFKAVNDSFGHSTGDTLLQSLAERLKAAVREGDTVARLGGDEFAVVMSDLRDRSEAKLLGERLIAIAEQPIVVDGRTLTIGMSVGIVIGPDHGRDVEELFKNADIALYRAKLAGRSAARFFERGMDTVVAKRNGLEQDLRDAVKNGGLTLHYQPIIESQDGSLLCFEALLRWHHPLRGDVPPAEFIPVAEETGLIVPLGDWVVREACRQASSWPATCVAVNVSAVQFQQPDSLRRSILSALAASRLPPERLELEITEGVLIQDIEASIACLHRLRDCGIRIALDDFGTGYSSLSYLRRFPFDKIKIDKTFVHGIDDADTAAIVRAVVGLAQRAGAAVTAEGVETLEQLRLVREAGCTEVQGFLLSRALPPAFAAEMARVSQQRHAA